MRSKFEEQIAKQISDINSLGYLYESDVVYYTTCKEYIPDFKLDNGIYLEVKGYFDAEARRKHLLIKEQHPELDIRFVFQRAQNKIHKLSDTTYADWCDRHGFKWCDKEIPKEWLK